LSEVRFSFHLDLIFLDFCYFIAWYGSVYRCFIAVVVFLIVVLLWGDALARVRFSFSSALILLDFAILSLSYCFIYHTCMLVACHHSLAYRLIV
jgi:hypothetical protein